MLAANYYPAFKKYKHFIGNYGNAWWKQKEEFESFNGAILMTTNCIVPPKDSYKHKLFTTGSAGFPGCKHIGEDKDFSEIIELAKTCEPPTEIERGEIIGGFAHNQVLALADKIVDAVKSGDIKRFVVMGGCDGRAKSRNYYTDFAKALPKDTVILTAGCAKFKYNKLDLGDIGGIPRVLDAGQCNDSSSFHRTLYWCFSSAFPCYIVYILAFDVHIFLLPLFLYSKCTQQSKDLSIINPAMFNCIFQEHTNQLIPAMPCLCRNIVKP